jgi:hypothetical protein
MSLRSTLILSYLCLGLKDCGQIIFTALHLGKFMSTLKIILRNLFGPDGLYLYNPTQTCDNPVPFRYPCFCITVSIQFPIFDFPRKKHVFLG